MPIFESGDLKIDLSARRVLARICEVRLTRMEYKMLATLVRHAGEVLTHQFLAKEVWGASTGGKYPFIAGQHAQSAAED